MNSTLRLMANQLGWALRDIPTNHAARATIESERSKIATFALVFDAVMDVSVRL